ncbi:hypothetical protein CRYUN_Cryun32bG0023400 [Craigia yunnanensis]
MASPGSLRSLEKEDMSAGVSLKQSTSILMLELFMFSACFHECLSSPLDHLKGYVLTERGADAFLPKITPSAATQPFLPLAPSPLSPFTNSTVPELSGLCMLNFTAAQSLMSMTSIDCWAAFAPLLAHVICCPQLHATLVILVGQSSKKTGLLALNRTLAKPCLSDIEQVLAGQGAGDNLKQICSIHPSNLTEVSCPVKDVDEFENTVNSSELLASCEKIDPVKECCDQLCQGAISEAATRLALKASDLWSMDGPHVLPEHSTRVNDCKTVALRWLARLKLQKYDITKNVYSLCHISLKDFSLQVSGCLLPSLPSDATFDKFSGISFICDLNDNIPAPWPSLSLLPASACNKTVRIPALPAATNAQSGLYNEYVTVYLLIASSMVIMMFLQF